MILLRLLIGAVIVVGSIFALAGTVGIIRMPDTYSRMQASTCITTMGAIGALLGAALYAALILHAAGTAVKIIVIGLLILTVNPVGAHAIARGAYRNGIRPDNGMKIDDLGRDFDE